MNDRIADKLALLPSLPGVYKMYDADGTVIYVGKAKNLKNRVRQYFQSSRNHTSKVSAMVAHIDDFETIVVSSEAEALSLESNLIKQFQPKYNILLKDDKHFPYLRIDWRQDYPRPEIVRRVRSDGATYLGPFITGPSVQEELKLIYSLYPLRHCKKNLQIAKAKRQRPCLMHHIGKCCAPCSGEVPKPMYHGYLRDAVRLLEGKSSDLAPILTAQMQEASDAMDFERAAVLRDKLRAIRALQEKQVAISTSNLDADVFACGTLQDDSLVFALYVRNGKIVGTHAYPMEADAETSREELLSAFLNQYYGRADVEIPPLILLASETEDRAAFAAWLSAMKKRKVELSVPQRGEKHDLVLLAKKNCTETIEKNDALRRRAWERGEGALCELTAALDLEEIPSRIECFDTSHLMGSHSVSSMVVFTDGKPDKHSYRHYRLREAPDGDDLKALREALSRRFLRGEPYPDLLIVDGGKTQLQVAATVLEEQNLSHIPIAALAESEDWIYTAGSEAPIILPRTSAAQHLIQRIRDEAHRFAITYHRSLRSRAAIYSELDAIAGIGDKRKRALFDRFLTIDAIRAASVEELNRVPSMTLASAEAVYRHFHPDL